VTSPAAVSACTEVLDGAVFCCWFNLPAEMEYLEEISEQVLVSRNLA
jgi:hypothetical protein